MGGNSVKRGAQRAAQALGFMALGLGGQAYRRLKVTQESALYYSRNCRPTEGTAFSKLVFQTRLYSLGASDSWMHHFTKQSVSFISGKIETCPISHWVCT